MSHEVLSTLIQAGAGISGIAIGVATLKLRWWWKIAKHISALNNQLIINKGTTMEQINESLAKRVLEVVDAGLVSGLGKPKPGSMCVEAAVCYAMGLPHSDKPTCVGDAVRRFKIRLNDAKWSSNAARTEGLRRLAIAQLGSESVDQKEFARIVVEQTIRQIVPRVLRIAKKRHQQQKHQDALEQAAIKCEQEGTREAAKQARSAATAAYAAATAAAYAAATTAYAAAYATATAAAATAAATAYADTAAATAYAYADADAAAYATATAYADTAAATAYADAADAAAYATATAAYATATATAADAAAADAAADAADAAAAADAARDEMLNLACEIGLQALIALGSPGCAYLYLTERTP